MKWKISRLAISAAVIAVASCGTKSKKEETEASKEEKNQVEVVNVPTLTEQEDMNLTKEDQEKLAQEHKTLPEAIMVKVPLNEKGEAINDKAEVRTVTSTTPASEEQYNLAWENGSDLTANQDAVAETSERRLEERGGGNHHGGGNHGGGSHHGGHNGGGWNGGHHGGGWNGGGWNGGNRHRSGNRWYNQVGNWLGWIYLFTRDNDTTVVNNNYYSQQSPCWNSFAYNGCWSYGSPVMYNYPRYQYYYYPAPRCGFSVCR